MKILFNCTNNVVGGAVQNSANFIRLALNDHQHDFLFLTSVEVYDLLQDMQVNCHKIICINRRGSLLSRDIHSMISSIEKNFNPDIVYTMAGPTYLKFKSYHVMGISDGYITHSKLANFFHNQEVLASTKKLFTTVTKGLISRFTADSYIFQTETARTGFCKRYKLSKENTIIVPNAVGERFKSNKYSQVLKNKPKYKNISLSSDYYYILCPSAYYSHKDIELLFLLDTLIHDSLNIKLIVTISDRDYINILNRLSLSSSNIINIGPYSYNDSIKVYSLADAIILPSTLETFSTTYIEAIALRLPLIVADEPFSREICGNYANYFKTGSVKSLLNILASKEYKKLTTEQQDEAEKITEKYRDQSYRYYLIMQGLKHFYEQY